MRNDLSVIAKLRTRYGGKASRINLFDANARRQQSSVGSGSAYTRRLTFNLRGRSVRVNIGEELAFIEVRGAFDIPILTLNAPDRIGFRSEFAGTVRIGLEELAVFTSDGVVAEPQKRILDSKEMRTLVAFHTFLKGEAIHLYRNGIVLYTRNDVVNPELIGALCALAETLPVDAGALKKLN